MTVYYRVTRLDFETPRIGKPLMRIQGLVFYFHADSLLKSEMTAT